MKNIFRTIFDKVNDGVELILALVISASGSTPRGAGAKMIVFQEGRTEGTIGGGRLEHICTKTALAAIREKRSFTETYDLSINDADVMGMICGGSVDVCFKYFSQEDKELLRHIVSVAEKEEPSWLIVRERPGQIDIGTYDQQRGASFIDEIDESIADSFTMKRRLFVNKSEKIYVEPLTKRGRVYIFGAGHLTKELAPMLKRLDFHVIVYEEKTELADKFIEDIPLVRGSFGKINENVSMKQDDYAVIMTSGHWADFEVLEQVLRLNLSYVGVIGSRKKMEITKERLFKAGIEKEKINSIHTPIGLAIKAETPAEIAVSVAAELILHRAERSAGGE
ncbi:putative xanthine dehydrogenase subunit A [Clostridiales bacterium]|nr:putative xanthine dehydrogenase subunit A [Clostridiales bacterium]